MSYRRRENPIFKVCQQCQSSFQTWHAGRIYCGQACNMTAWRHRHRLHIGKAISELVNEPVGKLSFSLPNLTTIAAGSLLADGAKFLLNDQPTPANLLRRIEKLEYNMAHGLGNLVTRVKTLQDHNRAVEQANPILVFSAKRGQNENSLVKY